MVQGELFREERAPSTLQEERKSFFSRYRATLTLDKLLIVAISTVVLFAFTYSFGVEQGKRVMEAQLGALVPTHGDMLNPVESESETLEVATAIASDEEIIVMVVDTTATEGSASRDAALEPIPNALDIGIHNLPGIDPGRADDYTVQLVTYTDEAHAISEVHRLESNGFESFVIPSGPFFQVCANYFRVRSHAKTVLEHFRATGRYPGAYVRPVVR